MVFFVECRRECCAKTICVEYRCFRGIAGCRNESWLR